MTEDEFYSKKIKPILIKKGVYFYRVEYKRMPDIYTCKNNRAIWIELKCINSKMHIIKPKWTKGQISWVNENGLFGNSNICLGLYYCGGVYFLTPKETYTELELIDYQYELNY